MKKNFGNITKEIGVLLAVVTLFGCQQMPKPEDMLADLNQLENGKPVIVRQEVYGEWNREDLKATPEIGEMGWDLRSYNLQKFDLSQEKEAVKQVLFDTNTQWPEKMPPTFIPADVLEWGKNPGLGIGALHQQGVTGKGVSIAIIDQALLVEHEEYKENIKLYERLHSQDLKAQMHGPAVASIAVGKTIGVAPDANVYYIASTFGEYTETDFKEDLTIMADGILRVLEINRHLPENEKIRVISISKGFGSDTKDGKKVEEAIEQADKEGVFVITTSTKENYDFALMGLGREFMSDPDKAESYLPGYFWAESYYEDPKDEFWNDILLVPMDGRTYASWTGTQEYEFGAGAGLSWTCPWLAGMYALCVQENSAITPQQFVKLALETGDTIELDGEIEFGRIVNPERLIEAVRESN